MKLTGNAVQEVNGIYQEMKWKLEGREITVENVAPMVSERCGNLNFEEALSLCGRIWKSSEELYGLCEDKKAMAEPGYVEKMLDNIAESMDREQRKGFYLQTLDSFQKNEAAPEETAARAALPEEELKRLLADRIREFAKTVVFEMADTLEDSRFQGAGEAQHTETLPTKKEAFLFAVAEYMAVLDGVLPCEFGECPEMLGIGAAVQIKLAQFCPAAPGLPAEEYAEEYGEIMEGLICAAIGAAMAIGSAAVGLAAESVLMAMSFSSLGLIASVIISTSLYLLFIYGCIALIGGLGLTVTACVCKCKDKYQAWREGAYLETKETVLQENSWQKQENWKNRENGDACMEVQGEFV